VNIAVGGFKGGVEVNYFFDGGAESGGYPLATWWDVVSTTNKFSGRSRMTSCLIGS
jgi:hypothetical protein